VVTIAVKSLGWPLIHTCTYEDTSPPTSSRFGVIVHGNPRVSVMIPVLIFDHWSRNISTMVAILATPFVSPTISSLRAELSSLYRLQTTNRADTRDGGWVESAR